MKNRMILAFVGLLSVGVFAGLAQYGWTHRYGSPQTFEPLAPRVLMVPFQPRSLPLDPGDVADEAWQDVPGLDVDLMPQMSQPPWTTGLTPAVRVQAFHDGRDIYFRLRWQDDVPNRTLSVDSFVDGCAVAIPLETAAPAQSIMMGFSSPVNVWHWQAHKGDHPQHAAPDTEAVEPDYRYPFEDGETLPVSQIPREGAVGDLLAGRAGSLTPKRRQVVQGQAHWENGVWAVVFKRVLRTEDTEQDSQFAWGRSRASFAVWDGDQGDRGSRKSMSDWVILEIQAPAEKAQVPSSNSQTSTKDRTSKFQTAPAEQVAALGAFEFRAVLAGLAQVSDAATSVSPEPKVIEVVAQRFRYTPNRISVRKGQRLTLHLESLDVTHGLYLDGYGIDIKARPGVVGKATFTADKPGRFTFRCSETCGEFHPYMVGFLDVKPNTRFGVFAAATGLVFVVIFTTTLRRSRRERGTGSETHDV